MTGSGDTPKTVSTRAEEPPRVWRPLAAARPEVESDEGQTVTEYGIVLGVLMLLLAATALLLEPGIQSVVTTAGNKVSGILP